MTLPSDPHAYPQLYSGCKFQPNILFIGTPQILIKPSQHLQGQNYLCEPQERLTLFHLHQVMNICFLTTFGKVLPYL